MLRLEIPRSLLLSLLPRDLLRMLFLTGGDMKIYFNSANGETAPTVIDGDPPTDQSALVASLQSQLSTANAQIAQFKTFRDAVVADANTRKAADAAKTEGQDLIDAASGLPA